MFNAQAMVFQPSINSLLAATLARHASLARVVAAPRDQQQLKSQAKPWAHAFRHMLAARATRAGESR
jgi:hypothetical protein